VSDVGSQRGPGPTVRIGGRYELGELLGRGGMAEVRSATDLRLGRTVAVKRLRTDLATDPTFQARFRREAQAAAGLNHPNIVSVYDTGEELAPDGSHVQPFIVMEYVAGRTLRDVLEEGRKILPERALEITREILAALDYSHRAGIVHRDIKPANVMLTPSGQVKVMDFGIARAVEDGTATVTQTAAVVGTAQYLSPEQARGETVDSRSDVYSTGCVLFELLAGRPPFVGDSAFAVAYQHVREQAQPPSTYNPDVGADLDAIVMKALAKRVEDRYQSAAEMQADIERHLDGRPVDAATVLFAAPAAAPLGPTEAQPTSLFAAAQQYDEDRRRSRWPAYLVGVLVLLLLGAAVVAGMQLFNEEETPQVTVPTLRGLTQAQAEQAIERAGLEVGQVNRRTSDQPRGLVLDQAPDPLARVDESTDVDLVVSAGARMVTIPFVIGDPRDKARAELEDLDLVVRFEPQQSTEEADSVLATDPEAGVSVEAGSTVTVTYSTGPVEVPNVVGLTRERAQRVLTDAGLEVAVEEDDETVAEPGTVLSQNPPAVTPVEAGSTVTIVVSTFVEPSPSPSESPTEEPTPSETASPTETPTSPDNSGPGNGGGNGNGGDGNGNRGNGGGNG
jgi:beta-lactam-binding protein with PASTA domain/predicted Ser/Thr protein kinase